MLRITSREATTGLLFEVIFVAREDGYFGDAGTVVLIYRGSDHEDALNEADAVSILTGAEVSDRCEHVLH